MTTVPRDLSLFRNIVPRKHAGRRAAPLLIFHTVYGPLSGSARSVPLVLLVSFSPSLIVFPFARLLLLFIFFSRSCHCRVSSTWTRIRRSSEACHWNFSYRARALDTTVLQKTLCESNVTNKILTSNFILIFITLLFASLHFYLCSML